MGSVEINVGHGWTEDVRHLHGLRDVRPAGATVDLTEIRDIIDIVVDGRNITSRVTEERIFGVIGSLVRGLVRLVEGRSPKVLVEFECEPWELVVRPTAEELRISLYSVGHQRQVIAHEIGVARDTFLDAVEQTAESMLEDLYHISEQFASDDFVQSFDGQLERLRQSRERELDMRTPEAPTPVGTRRASTSSAAGLTLQYEIDADFEPLRAYGGQHAFDLQALLTPGRLEAEFRGRSVPLSGEFPFLSMMALVDRCRELLGAIERSDDWSFECQSPLFHVTFDVDAEGGTWSLQLGDPSGDDTMAVEMPGPDCLDLVLTVAEMMVDDLRDLNYHLDLNHRLTNLEREARELRNWYEELSGANVYHDEPEDYLDRRAGIRPSHGAPPATAQFPWSAGTIDELFARRSWEFRARRIYLSGLEGTDCGLVVPTEDSLRMLDWTTGEVAWEIDGTPRGDGEPTSFSTTDRYAIVTRRHRGTSGIDLRTGECQFELPSEYSRERLLLGAAEFDEPGLVVSADRRGHVVAADPDDGEVAWRFEPGHGRFAGCLFDGPLVAPLSREGFFYGIDPTDGDVLWKIRLGGLAQLEPIPHQGRLYAFTHDPNRRELTVHAVEPYTGRTRWRSALDGTLAGRPGFVDRWLIVPLERRGRLSVAGLDLEAEQPSAAWRRNLDSDGGEPSHIVGAEVEEEAHAVIQTDLFELSCIRAADGEILWRTGDDDKRRQTTGGVPLATVGDSVLSARDGFEFRALDSGRLLHSLPQPFHAPDYLAAVGQLAVVVGEANTPSDIEDRLVGLDLGHFLAEVGD